MKWTKQSEVEWGWSEVKYSEVKCVKWSEKSSKSKFSEVNKAKRSGMKWNEVQVEGKGKKRVFMEKVYRSSKWWEVKDWGESGNELMIVKQTITRNCTQYS